MDATGVEHGWVRFIYVLGFQTRLLGAFAPCVVLSQKLTAPGGFAICASEDILTAREKRDRLLNHATFT